MQWGAFGIRRILVVMPEVVIDEMSYENFIASESIIGDCSLSFHGNSAFALKG